MADRYPLVYNPSANQLQELQSGDSLDLGNAGLKNVTESLRLDSKLQQELHTVSESGWFC